MEHTDGLLKDVEDPASPRQLMQFIGTELLQLLQERFPKIGRTIFADL
jgi:hypothetical protein